MSENTYRAPVPYSVANSLSVQQVSAIVSGVTRAQAEVDRQILVALNELVAAGDWKDAINLVITKGRVTEAELAEAIGSNRSTIHRWCSGETVPPNRSMPVIVEIIGKYLGSITSAGIFRS